LAVIGPNANVTRVMIGNYAGIPCKYTTPFQGLQKYSKAIYQPGCTNVSCIGSGLINAAVQAATTADAVVLVVGLDQSIEAEGRDRVDLLLPGQQQNLVSNVSSAAKGPVILVIMSAGPIDISFAKHNDKISGILWVGYPGQAGGDAIAQTIFGDYNPGGRLPSTWYPQDFVTKVPMTDMNMRPDLATGYPGRTYRFYTGETVYDFGYGLSYTSFQLSLVFAPEVLSVSLETTKKLSLHSPESNMLDTNDDPLYQEEFIEVGDTDCKGLMFDLVVEVKNRGVRTGNYVALLFSKTPYHYHIAGAPKKQLIRFNRVEVKAKEYERIEFRIDVCKDLSIVDRDGRRKLFLGKHILSVGSYKFEDEYLEHHILLLRSDKKKSDLRESKKSDL
jgi:beta-D-xylosidase 4